jgi:hypothetical protein
MRKKKREELNIIFSHSHILWKNPNEKKKIMDAKTDVCKDDVRLGLDAALRYHLLDFNIKQKSLFSDKGRPVTTVGHWIKTNDSFLLSRFLYRYLFLILLLQLAVFPSKNFVTFYTRLYGSSWSGYTNHCRKNRTFSFFHFSFFIVLIIVI